MIAVMIFFVAQFALMVGVSAPDKFYFDEVHYVPAARQMLAPVISEPLLNPMHPPPAKQLIALSISGFGDNPLGWRYGGVLFGALAIVAIYFCGCALFAAEGPAVASALIALGRSFSKSAGHSGRKGVASSPMCGQKIGQMGF